MTLDSIFKNPLTFIGKLITWLSGAFFIIIGFINTFWGNDPGYGLFVVALAFLFFPPVTDLIRNITGFSIPWYLKVLLALFILWSALGVAELPDKIDLMMQDLG
jgi:cobalamin biosynthesis protein CobD/CbiB